MGISVLILRNFSTWWSDNVPQITPQNDLFILCTWTYSPHPCIGLGLIIGNSSLHLWWYFWFPTSEPQVHLENLVNLCSYSCTYSLKYRYVKYQDHMLPSSCQGWSVGHLAIWLPTPLPPHHVQSPPLPVVQSHQLFLSISGSHQALLSLWALVLAVWPGTHSTWFLAELVTHGFQMPPPQKTPSWALWVTWSSSSLLLPSTDPCTLPF